MAKKRRPGLKPDAERFRESFIAAMRAEVSASIVGEIKEETLRALEEMERMKGIPRVMAEVYARDVPFLFALFLRQRQDSERAGRAHEEQIVHLQSELTDARNKLSTMQSVMNSESKEHKELVLAFVHLLQRQHNHDPSNCDGCAGIEKYREAVA